ncbi:unnamed protein product [Leptosia nina]|uniref:Ty3 transposon capsid-like protein domain-containing protein n=1 Tax=Leptosia nina TaxID=320188 RepID=A0AAV1JI57_9NEOP
MEKPRSQMYELTQEQFERLLTNFKAAGNIKMTSFPYTFSGAEDGQQFLSALRTFKDIENINDQDAMKSLPVLLKGDAAQWWHSIKNEKNTWSDFIVEFERRFVSPKPAYQIYRQIFVTQKQEKTKEFINQKRILFSKLPSANRHSENQQIDMIYGLLKITVQNVLMRDDVRNFNDFLQRVQNIEDLESLRLNRF